MSVIAVVSRMPGAATALTLLLSLAGGMTAVAAQSTPAPIYSCIDADGKRLTSDRPIRECTTRDQRVLNTDGSVRRIIPPTPTADERAEFEAREREAMTERVARQDAIRRDRNLLIRFPNEAAHRKAREAALDDIRKAVSLSEARVALLARERNPLLDEAEFYAGRTLPLKLQTQLDANDAATEAQRTLIQNQQVEVVRINQLYDSELDRLKKLWAGAQPGSMGTLAKTPAASAVVSKTVAK